jgi:hypothetical protein
MREAPFEALLLFPVSTVQFTPASVTLSSAPERQCSRSGEWSSPRRFWCSFLTDAS